jgi:oligopeptide/dipeptide ABC transporter ATP-binding protein
LINEIKSKTNSSTILITHDLGVVAKYADRVMVMYAGKTVEFSEVDNIYYKSMHPYTLGLMNSITRLDESKDSRLKPIEGSPPSLIDLPEGCTFKNRCVFSRDECGMKFPPLVEIEKGHLVACFRAKEIFEERNKEII